MQASALIKFQHCDFSAEMAKASDAYDTADATAWIAPFTIAQKDYWARQPVAEAPNWLTAAIINYGITFDSFCGHLCNKYADDLATQRSAAIASAAQSAYDTCVAGGASTPAAQAVEPEFKLSLHTQLNGGNFVGATGRSPDGPVAQIMVPFAPANPVNANPANHLPWQPFYRLGPISWAVNSPENWTLSFSGVNPYSQPFYVTTPMRSSININVPWLTSLSALLERYIDDPVGYTVSDGVEGNAGFTALVSSLDFTVTRHVFMPDGTHSTFEVNYFGGAVAGFLGSTTIPVYFPEFTSDCEESGLVEVFHTITAYTAETVYELNSNVEMLRGADGVARKKRLPVGYTAVQGANASAYPPEGFNSIYESFNYVRFNLGIVRVKYYQSGIFQYQRMFLVWTGVPLTQQFLEGLTSDNVQQFYDKNFTQGADASRQVQILPVSGGSTSLNVIIDVPIIEDVVVSNIFSGVLSVSASSHIVYENSLIKVRNVLKPSNVYTPLGDFGVVDFVIPNPTYQAAGGFLSVLPDFVDHRVLSLGIVAVRYHRTGLGWPDYWHIQHFLVWKGEPIDPELLKNLEIQIYWGISTPFWIDNSNGGVYLNPSRPNFISVQLHNTYNGHVMDLRIDELTDDVVIVDGVITSGASPYFSMVTLPVGGPITVHNVLTTDYSPTVPVLSVRPDFLISL